MARTQTSLVRNAQEICQSLVRFNVEAREHARRAEIVLGRTWYWVYHPTEETFGPSKFVGFAGMTFRLYESLCNHDRAPYWFDGGRTRQAIERVLGEDFSTQAALIPRLRRWGESLLGSRAFGNASEHKWRFLAL